MNFKNGKVFTSKFVGTGPSSYKKRIPGRRLTKVEKHWPNTFVGFHSGEASRDFLLICGEFLPEFMTSHPR